MSIIADAIVPAGHTVELVQRPSLDRFVPEIVRAGVAIIRGAAGTGKTSALLQWSDAMTRAGRPVIWLGIRNGIGKLDGFLEALKAAYLRAGLPWPDTPPRLDGTNWSSLLVGLEGCRAALFIDDSHLLGTEALDFLVALLDAVGDATTVVLAFRGEPRIPVARLRALGRLVEFDGEDLALQREEAAEIVVRRVGGPVEANALQHILDEMNGWAAGIVTASNLYRRERERGERIPRLARLWDEMSAYFDEEVLVSQSNDIRRFLLETSILDDLTAAACVAVTGDPKAEVLLAATRADGIFIEPVDRARLTYAYHPLFRRFLMERATTSLGTHLGELHRRASLFYVAVGDESRAIEHAAATGDQTFLADQLDALGEALTYKGYLFRVAELGGPLPWPLLSTRPMLLLSLAWRRIRSLGFASAERLIAAAVACRAQGIEDGTLPAFDAERLDHHIRHRRLMLASAQDRMVDVERDAGELLDKFGDDYPYLSCSLLAQLMSARRELYHFHDMLKLEAETRRALDRPGSEFASIALKSSIAPTLMAQGKTELTRRLLGEALHRAEGLQAASHAIAPLPAMPLAELLYDANEMAEAQGLVEKHLAAVRHWGFVDQLASGYLTRARLAFARGDICSALRGLQEAHLVALECGLDRLRAFVVAEQVRVLIKSGQVDEAEAAFCAGDLKLDQEPVPTLNPTRRHESIAVAWLRIQIQRHRLSRARAIARRWLEFVKHRGAIRSAVVFELLLAEIAVLQGNRTEAKRAVRAAVELAEPGGWLRIFIDEGEVITSLLAESYGSSPSLDSPVDRFAENLLTLCRADQPVARRPGAEPDEDDYEEEVSLAGQLVGREIDVLLMVKGGLLNREIGDRLGMTEGTVKWYMQQIYDKLGVRRRQQAVIRARQLGILP